MLYDSPLKIYKMENEENVKSRLIEFLRSKKISKAEFTRRLGVSPTYISAMRKGIPTPKLKKIGELYPDLNRDWLLYGEGEMLIDPEARQQNANVEEYETLLLPLEAVAGGLQMWSRGVRREDCRKILSPVSGADFAIPISGDSMEPRFHNGSTLLIKKINEKAFIPWGHTLVVDTENGVVIKNILPGEGETEEGEEYVIAESINPKYPPFKIPYSSIYGIYRVMGTVDVFTSL